VPCRLSDGLPVGMMRVAKYPAGGRSIGRVSLREGRELEGGARRLAKLAGEQALAALANSRLPRCGEERIAKQRRKCAL